MTTGIQVQARDQVQSIATAAGTTPLSNASPELTIFTGSTSQTVSLPDATTCSLGQRFKMHNLSSGGYVYITTFSGVVLTSIASGVGVTFELVQTTVNTAAAWMQTGNVGEVVTANNWAGSGTLASGALRTVQTMNLAPGKWNVFGSCFIADSSDPSPALRSVIVSVSLSQGIDTSSQVSISFGNTGSFAETIFSSSKYFVLTTSPTTPVYLMATAVTNPNTINWFVDTGGTNGGEGQFYAVRAG